MKKATSRRTLEKDSTQKTKHKGKASGSGAHRANSQAVSVEKAEGN